MIKKIFILFLFLFTLLSVNAQYGNIWPVGKMQGIDFNGKAPKLIKTGINNDSVSMPPRINECHTSAISDCNGNVLFYTNGIDIWNKKDTIMDNGRLNRSIGGNIIALNRNCLIIPIPGQSSYYVFYMVYKGKSDPDNNFCMAKVNMTLNSGLGGVVFKDSVVYPGIMPSTNLTYARHANDTDIWLLTSYNQNKICAFKITASGLIKTPVISLASSAIFTETPVNPIHGFMKMTNNNKKLIVTGIIASFNSNGHVLSYDFDRKNGYLSNEYSIVAHNEFANELFKSIAFSPNDSLIYFSIEPWAGYTGKNFCRILQYNIFSHKKLIVKNFTYPLGWSVGSTPGGRFSLQTAPDGKTYVFLLNKIYCINFPNRKGAACNITYWDSLNYMNYVFNGNPNELSIFSLPNIYMPERKLYFTSSTEANPCTDTTIFTYLGDTTYYKVIWYFGDGDSLIQSQPLKYGTKIKHDYKNDGNYEVMLQSWHTICNRKKEYSDSIIVKLNPKIILLKKQSSVQGCYFDSLTMVYQFRNAAKLVIDWGNGNIPVINLPSTDTIGLLNQNYIKEKKYKISYKLSAGNSCYVKGKDSFTAIFNPKPVLNLKVTGSLQTGLYNGKPVYKNCEPMTLNLYDSSLQFKSIKINWYNGDSVNSSNKLINNIVFNNTDNKNYTFGLNIFETQNIYNCLFKDTFYSKVYAKPKANFLLDTLGLCFKSNGFSFINKSKYQGFADSLKYKIDWGDGNTQIGLSKISHKYSNVGSSIVKLSVGGEFGCMDTSIQSLKVYGNPIAKSIITSKIQCLNGNNFELIIQNNNDYKFDWGDGNKSSFSSFISGQKLYHQYVKNGNYNILLIARDTHQCLDSQFQNIQVLQNPKATFSLSDSGACLNNNKFTVATNINYLDIDSVSSAIYFGDGWNYNQQKGNIVNSHSYSTFGMYLIKLVIVSNYGCKDSIEKKVSVFTHPRLSLSASNVCLGDSTQFECKWNLSENVTGISWTSSDFSRIDQKMQPNESGCKLNYLYSGSGTFNVKINAVNDARCIAEYNVSPVVFALPVADFKYQKIESAPVEISFQFYDNSKTGIGWLWDFDKKGVSSSRDPFFKFQDTGFKKVVLIVFDRNQCTDTFSQIITAFPDFSFYFPNAVTINDDNLNESFGTNVPAYIKEMDMEIYNRWGELVFKTDNKSEMWQPKIEGVYMYKIKLKDLFLMMHYYSGTVTVLK